ncbi:MAG: hypothetical protein NXH97_08710 [Rhodobacteraceae bacterium]|nr:hypothetical protein [Paracoccaceae bacterium]
MALLAALPMVLFGIAFVLGVFGVPFPSAGAGISPFVAWMLVVSLGLNSLWAAFGHLAATERVAASIGWDPSPFQIEIGFANLGIGMAAIVAAFMGAGAAVAITVMAACFLWGAAMVHTREMIEDKNFSINNAGPIFFWDILTPLTLIVALLVG